MASSFLSSLTFEQVQGYVQRAIEVISDPKVSGGLILAATLPLAIMFWVTATPRQNVVRPYNERVVILGASSGTGEQLALEYAARGCRRVVLVGRRQEQLEEVKKKCDKAAKEGEEWTMSQHAPGWEEQVGKERFFVCKADCSNPADVIKIRDLVMKELGGLDTLHICFGVSALKPVLGLANVDPVRPAKSAVLGSTPPSSSSLIHPSLSGLQDMSSIVGMASHINVTATAICLATFVPILQTTNSPDPVIVLLSSVAALIPAPTRGLYGATKASQLQLFESMAIECESHADFSRVNAAAKASKRKPERRQAVRFIAVCPGTIMSDFRASAVDVKPGEEGEVKDDSWDALQKAKNDAAAKDGSKVKPPGDILTPNQVAVRTIFAVDRGTKGKILMPSKYYYANLFKPLIGGYLRKQARKKYAY